MRIGLEDLFRNIAYLFIHPNYRKFIWLSLKLGFKKRYEETSTKISGFTFKIPDALSFIWQYHEIFFKESYKFIPKYSQPIIYDCGANIGTSVIYLKNKYPNAIIHAFEPDPKIFHYLKQNIKLNKVQNVQLFNEAVWKEDTYLNFSSEGADGGNIDNANESSIQVKATRLKTLLEKEKYVDFLKIDIEGAEYAVLEDCSDVLYKVENIFVECHSFPDKPQELGLVLAILEKNGFRYYIENESNRKIPFINKLPKSQQNMDMQVNIYGYKSTQK